MTGHLSGIFDNKGRTTLHQGDEIRVKVRSSKVEIFLSRNGQMLYWKTNHSDDRLSLNYPMEIGLQVAHEYVHGMAAAAGLTAIQTNLGEFKTADFYYLIFVLKKE